MLPGQVSRLGARLVLLQHPDDLVLSEPCSLHLSVPRQAGL